MTNTSATGSKRKDFKATLFQPDILAGYEYLATYHRKSHIELEKKLMFAVLEDAIKCYRAYAFARPSALRRRYLEAEQWIWQNDYEWLFSYNNICEVLQLDPFGLRRRLLRWKRAQNGCERLAKPKAGLPRRRGFINAPQSPVRNLTKSNLLNARMD